MKCFIYRGKLRVATKAIQIPIDKLSDEIEAKIEKLVESGKASVSYWPDNAGLTVYTIQEGEDIDPMTEAEQSYEQGKALDEAEMSEGLSSEEESMKAMEDNLLAEGYKVISLPAAFLKNNTVKKVIENFESETNSQILGEKLYISPEGVQTWKDIYMPALKSYFGELQTLKQETG